MVLKFLRDEGGGRIDRIEATLQQMLVDDAHAFDLAMSALLDGSPPEEIGDDLRATDHRVNEAEREIRRELVVHASVHGGIDTPAVLVYMSIVKDVERVGDYAKNLYDVAADGGQLNDVADTARLQDLRTRVADFIEQCGSTFPDRDTDQARELLSRGDELLDEFDSLVSDLVRGQDQGAKAVARALTHRYMKRIVAHLMNLLSSVVMPIDRIDYFDEDPEDR